MAVNLPNALKAADITRFVTRAAQVEKVKPIVAYWCNYWVVDQIISKGLHHSDAESMTYTMALVEKLEQTKREHADDDTITDSVGQAYIEQFGLETFQRADNAVRANKASRQTADTFLAAATFLDLLHIWGPLDPEIASKIKFAKYHALRIAKALKAGEDPNLSNPPPEPSPLEEHPLDPNDPEVQALNRPSSPQISDKFRQASVEDASDEHNRMEYQPTPSSTIGQSLPPSAAPAHPDSTEAVQDSSRQDVTGENYYREATVEDQQTVEQGQSGRASSIGDGYFPTVPDGYSTGKETASSPYLTDEPEHPHVMDLPDSSSLPPKSPKLPDISPDPRPPAIPTNPAVGLQPFQSAYQPHAPGGYSVPPTSTTVPPARFVPQAQPKLPVKQVDYFTDEEAIMKAQKHARWAISALNFEDVKTAVTELKGALESLGAT